MNLDRFVDAQQYHYKIALSKIKSGRRRSHWTAAQASMYLSLGKLQCNTPLFVSLRFLGHSIIIQRY